MTYKGPLTFEEYKEIVFFLFDFVHEKLTAEDFKPITMPNFVVISGNPYKLARAMWARWNSNTPEERLNNIEIFVKQGKSIKYQFRDGKGNSTARTGNKILESLLSRMDDGTPAWTEAVRRIRGEG